MTEKHRLSMEKKKTDKVVFADAWQQFFSEFNLTSFNDFFKYSSGQIVNINGKRDVIVFTLGDGQNQKTFFMKRFHKPHHKDILRTWVKFGSPISQALVEWNAANLLLSHGIGTYRPVCFGEKTKWGCERKSFFVTEKLNAMELADFVAQKWLLLEQAQQKKIISDIAKFIRRIHDLNISLPDLYLWHFFIAEDCLNGGCQLSIIDLHRMSTNVNSPRAKLKNLAKFYWSMSEKYFNDEIKDFLLDEYMANKWNGSKSAIVKKIHRYFAKFANRRRRKRY